MVNVGRNIEIWIYVYTFMHKSINMGTTHTSFVNFYKIHDI